MFYSHQLLARKAPLGQIWRAATLHAKINRRKLDKLDIIRICEEILNPSVPMALRLSGILMGGVAIVYQRKVKLLYDDVTRLLVEVNQAWKMKASPDTTVLPKGKSQAKKEAVTLPDNQQTVETEQQFLNYSNAAATTVEFQQTAYFDMQLDNVDGFYVNDTGEEDASHHLHQAAAENITLSERFDSYQAVPAIYYRHERFDIEGDGETQNFSSAADMEITLPLKPFPSQQQGFQRDEIQDQHPKDQVNQQSNECKEVGHKQMPVKRKPRRRATAHMDYEQTIIPNHIYQSWLQDASNIVLRRGRKRKARMDIISSMKISKLMELPPSILIDDLSSNGEIYYPTPLLELWMTSTQDLPNSHSQSERTSPPLPADPSISSAPNRHCQDPVQFTYDDLHSGVGSRSLGASWERLRTNIVNDKMSMDDHIEEHKADQADLRNNGSPIPSAGSGHGIPHPCSEVNLELSNKKGPHSSSRHTGSSLGPIAEEMSWEHLEPNHELSRLSENEPSHDKELLVETGPTQTQHPTISQPTDKIADSIRMQMKTHFETPGAPEVESLNNLASGMNRKAAALLFYQTCVLASCDFLGVEQKVPYGDILISKGGKMH